MKKFATHLSLFTVPLLLALVGCSKQPDAPAAVEQQTTGTQAAAETSGGHDHGGWWCVEHGVPEEICGLCDSKLAAEFQRKGDWCKEHDRPDSQCFECHPELKATFAARYQAKYGAPPPEPEG